MNKKILVSLCVLNYNGQQFLDRCLSSLETLDFPKEQYEIVVIDNASQDDSIEFIKEKYPKTRIIHNKKNYGPAIANNMAFTTSPAKYVVLLNNDLHLHKDFLTNLIEVMENNHDAGCCGGTEYYYDEVAHTPKGNIRETSWMGCGATIYRQRALFDSGLFDTTFFYYCEDVDISWRLKLHGWKIFQNEKAIFFHAGKGRKISKSDKSFFYAWRNRIFLLIKFASISKLLQSLIFYSSLLMKKKKYNCYNIPSIQKNNDRSGQNLRIRRYTGVCFNIYFFMKLLLSIILYTPEMLIKRHTLKRLIKNNQKDVDLWIQHLDESLKN